MTALLRAGMALIVVVTSVLASSANRDPAAAEPVAGSGETAPAGVSVAVARERARTMHELSESTLEVIHRRYFHANRAMLPARAMEDVFSDMRRKSQIEARWVAVNTRAMSIDHEPKTAFEKRAANDLASGAPEVEEVEAGYYRRAAPIPLGNGCIGCHEGIGHRAGAVPRLAALVISVPVTTAEGEPSPAAP